MSRSNGPGVPPNGWPGAYPPADPHNPYQPQYPAQPGYPAQPQQATTGRPARIQPQGSNPNTGRPQQAPAGYAQPPQGYPAQPYAQPPPQAYQPSQQYAPQPPAHQAYQPSQHPQPYTPVRASPPPQASYAREPERTAPPSRQGPVGYAPQYQPQTTAPPQNYGHPPQGYQGGNPSWQGGQSPGIDPQGYDLGAYMPAPVQAPDWRTGPPTGAPAWSASQSVPPQAPYDRFDPSGQRPHAEYASMGASLDAGLQHHGDGHDQDHEQDYEDEPADADAGYEPSRPRYGMILASIVAAFAIGGGLTYGYKVYAGRPEQVAGAPTVKSGSDPFKVKPTDPGGTKFANTDAKVMDQLSGTDGGPRVVQTMKVERDGTITSGATSAPAPASAVPGMILVGGQQPAQTGPTGAAAGTLLAAASPQKPAAAQRATVVAAAQLPPAAAPGPDEVPAPVTAAPVAKKVPKKTLAPAAGVGGPAPSAANAPAPSGANGYVAVLASLPASGSSRMQAMQQFADLQQKYNDVLGSKAPDVVEAKVADKGTFHRLVVGPPASRDSASAVCAKLKASGYAADCWVTAF